VNLALAEDDYAAGLLEQRRQELRFSWRRDFRVARRALEQARMRAGTAVVVSHRSALRENRSAADVLASAETALSALDGAEDRVWMSPSLRSRLQRARTLMAEGDALMAVGAFEPAATQASLAHAEALSIARALRDVASRYTDEANLARWRTWEAETAAWSRRTGKAALVVDKDAHHVAVYRAGRIARVYAAELGWNNIGDKRRQGDGATPEGRYTVSEMKGEGRSRYHKALLLDYPNAEDLRNLETLRRSGAVPRGTRAGGLIEIHGGGGRGRDWTDGCVAVTNAQMDELFRVAGVGTPVVIVGSRSGEGVFSALARSLQP